MYDKPRMALCLLAAGSGLLLTASLFLPTFAVGFFAPPAGPVAGVGSIWSASKALTLVVAGLLLPAIFAPCVAATGRKWLLPLAVTILAMLTLVLMTVQAVFLGGEVGFGLTLVGYAALVVLALCTLSEAIVARRSAASAEPVS